MKPMIFTLRKRPTTRLDLSPLTPDKLNGLNINAIRAIKLECGGTKVALRDLFEISGEDTENLHFRRSAKIFTKLGHEMSRGKIEVRGHAGDFLGQGIKGGEISVRGDVGDWLGNAMSGGHIDISGDAGNFIGSALPGDGHGMSNGLITVWGNAGDRVGDTMRRGIICIKGDSGNYAGSRMIAGTIILLGKTGLHTGYGMKRGTIILAKKPQALPPSFQSCGPLKMEFLRLLFKQISMLGRRFTFFRNFGPEVERYAGDIACDGKGEIFILQNARINGA